MILVSTSESIIAFLVVAVLLMYNAFLSELKPVAGPKTIHAAIAPQTISKNKMMIKSLFMVVKINKNPDAEDGVIIISEIELSGLCATGSS